MKINTKDIMRYFIYVVVFLNLGYCSMFRNNIFRMMLLGTFISGIMFLIYCMNKKEKIGMSKMLWTYFILFYTIYFIQILRFEIARDSIVSFSSIWDLLLMYNNYFQILFCAFPIYKLLKEKDTRFINGLVVLGYIMLFLRLICWITYNYNGIILMPNFIRENWKREIFGHIYSRVSGTFIDGFLFCFSLHKFFQVKYHKKIKYFMGMVFILFFTVFVYQSRANLIYFLITFFITLIALPVNKKKHTNKILIVLLIVMIVLVNSNSIIEFFKGFSVNSLKYGAGTQVRIMAIQYFGNIMKQKSVLFGIGFTQDSFHNSLYYMSDLGILANFFKFGIIGMIVFLFPIFCAIKIIVKNGVKKMKYDSYYAFFFSLSVYVILMVINLDPYAYHMIGIMPIFLGFLVYFDSHKVEKKGKG